MRAKLAQLTLEQKVALCAGNSMWMSSEVAAEAPAIKVPAIKLSDGPNAVRGRGVGTTAACFPVGVALASTWNTELIGEVGRALGREAKSKGVQVLLGPTINLHRHPLGGRNFECYSEDPLLTGAMACAWVRGVQSEGVAGCAKHFVCNDSEYERHSISSEVAAQPLRELYLRPFERVVREAGVWTLMSAYNRVNGVFASSHSELLRDVLKGEWGFDGLVISDWGAALETVENANGGLDLEMPGPTRTRGEALLQAVRSGAVDEAAIEDSVLRLLRTIERTASAGRQQRERSDDLPADRALARQVAAEAMVLVRNEGGLLPFDPAQIEHLAVIGPNAAVGQIQGGGSSGVMPHYSQSPLAGLQAVFGRVSHAEGCTNFKYLPPPQEGQLFADEALSQSGLRLRLGLGDAQANDEANGPPNDQPHLVSLQATPWGFTPLEAPPQAGGEAFDLTLSGYMRADRDGVYSFSLASSGLSRLRVNGELVVDNWDDYQPGETILSFGSSERRGQLHLRAGQLCTLQIEFQSQPGKPISGLRLGLLPPQPADPIGEAVQLASQADAVVLVVGSNSDWESEGHDRTDMGLPGEQDELVRRVLAANPRCALVMNVGAPVSMPWFDSAPALLQAWLPGQEFGNALADLLTGASNPSGRMPSSFPVRLEDTPAFAHYPGKDGVMPYAEGLLLGYRWYDSRKIDPLVPFGHGLSYTAFSYADLTVEAADPPQVSLKLQNDGDRAGQEVVQLYLHRPGAGAERPEQELCGFAKVALAPGASQTVRIQVAPEALREWHTESNQWRPVTGPCELRVGASSRDIRLTASLAPPG